MNDATHKSSGRILICVVAVIGLLGCSARQLTPLARPAFERIVVKQIVIHPQVLPGAMERSDASVIKDLLGRNATEYAREVFVRQNISAFVTLPAQVLEESSVPVLNGTVVVPVSLPEGVRGISASMREGVLVGVTLSLSENNGVERFAVSTINWDDVWWSTGGHRRRRARPIDEVLAEAVRKGIESAVYELQRQISDEN